MIGLCENIKEKYDTIIYVLSSYTLNNSFLYRISEIIKSEHILNIMFQQMDSGDVLMEADFKGTPEKDWEKLYHSCFVHCMTQI
jgi:hypothetical protein